MTHCTLTIPCGSQGITLSGICQGAHVVEPYLGPGESKIDTLNPVIATSIGSVIAVVLVELLHFYPQVGKIPERLLNLCATHIILITRQRNSRQNRHDGDYHHQLDKRKASGTDNCIHGNDPFKAPHSPSMDSTTILCNTKAQAYSFLILSLKLLAKPAQADRWLPQTDKWQITKIGNCYASP